MTLQWGWGAATSQDQELEGPSVREKSQALTQTLRVSQETGKRWPGRKLEKAQPPDRLQLEEVAKLAENRKALGWKVGTAEGSRRA